MCKKGHEKSSDNSPVYQVLITVGKTT